MKKKNLSNLTDFLSDDSFVNWVRYGNENTAIAEEWDIWLEQNPDKQVLVREAKNYLTLLNSPVKPMDVSSKELLRSKILGQIGQNRSTSSSDDKNIRSMIPWNKMVWYAAASVVIIASVLALRVLNVDPDPSNASLIVQSNAAGDVTKISLSDGSEVLLSTSSTLQYLDNFDKTKREVTLIGEAFFNVVPDPNRPFIVSSGEVLTEVLGTKFNVKAYVGEDIEVSLTEGKVKVIENDNSDNQLVLSPSERAIFAKHSSTFEKTPFEEEYATAWMDRKIVFREADLNVIKSQLEKWYDVEINYLNQPSSETRLNAEFVKEPFDKVLKTIGLTLGFDFEVEGKRVEIDFLSEEN